MGFHFEVDGPKTDGINSLYLELLRAELRRELSLLKNKIIEIETKLEDPYG